MFTYKWCLVTARQRGEEGAIGDKNGVEWREQLVIKMEWSGGSVLLLTYSMVQSP